MDMIDKTCVGELMKKFGINFYGYAQGGYMYDTTAPQPYSGPTFLSLSGLRYAMTVPIIGYSPQATTVPEKKANSQ